MTGNESAGRNFERASSKLPPGLSENCKGKWREKERKVPQMVQAEMSKESAGLSGEKCFVTGGHEFDIVGGGALEGVGQIGGEI